MSISIRKETNLYDDLAIKSVNDRVVSQYAISTTGSNIVAKIATVDGNFELFKNARVSVFFKFANTATSPTLNIAGTGDKPIWAYGGPLSADGNTFNWVANSTIEFVYDGSHWLVADSGAVGLISAYDEELNQEVIFNKLTNNGVTQGIYLSNGILYINASYIQSGTLSANYIKGGILKIGGASNGNGVLEIYNSSGTRIGRWDNGALYLGNIASSLSAPNTKIDTDGTITTKSLTANDYIYVDGNGSSSIKIPISTGGKTGYTLLSYTGLSGYYGNDGYIWCGPLPNTSSSVMTAGFAYTNASTYSSSSEVVRIYSGRLEIGKDKFSVTYDGNIYTTGWANIRGNLTVGGTKNRLVDTKDYGNRLLYCYETSSPLFGDVGEGIISEDGKCYIQIDNIFSQTVSLAEYQVFLQKYGDGDCWVDQRDNSYFIVRGTPGLSFGWELKAKQSDFSQYRLERNTNDQIPDEIDYGVLFINHIENIKKEREIIQ